MIFLFLDFMTLSPDRQVSSYKSLLRIRRIEEMIADEYRNGTMRTPTHFGIGQEAVAVGVCDALTTDDAVFSHHRCHTHYLAKGGDLMGLVAELLGREAGCSRGRGGSVHLTDRSVGFYASSPILGQASALAVGAALAFQMDRKSEISVAFFGDGACDEGAVWESLNFAAIRRLPVLFVCENNLYATESPLQVRQAKGTDLCERAKAFKVDSMKVDGNDVFAVFQAASDMVRQARDGEGPFFLECMTYRWREHVGPLWDHEVNRTYRTKEEVDAWIVKCPVEGCARALLQNQIATLDDMELWRQEIEAEISGVLSRAKEAPWPLASTLFDNIV